MNEYDVFWPVWRSRLEVALIYLWQSSSSPPLPLTSSQLSRWMHARRSLGMFPSLRRGVVHILWQEECSPVSSCSLPYRTIVFLCAERLLLCSFRRKEEFWVKSYNRHTKVVVTLIAMDNNWVELAALIGLFWCKNGMKKEWQDAYMKMACSAHFSVLTTSRVSDCCIWHRIALHSSLANRWSLFSFIAAHFKG